MTRPVSLRWFRRSWPQKVRTKLTLIYAALFLAGGSLLLGLTYGLVAASLPERAAVSGKAPMTQDEFLKLCKQPHPKASLPVKSGTRRPGPKQSGPLQAKIKRQCSQESAYLAGSQAAAARQRQRALHNLLLFSALGLGVMTILSAGAGWIVAGRVLRPVRMITGTARRASEENLGERIALAGARDELKELADTFDDMLERLDRAFTAQRRFVADASHELRTPLTVMRTAIDVTLAKPARTQEQLESMAVRVRRAIGRAEDMIDALLTLAISEHGRANRNEPFNLATAAEDAIDAAATQIQRLDLKLHADLDPAETAGDLPTAVPRCRPRSSRRCSSHSGAWRAGSAVTEPGSAWPSPGRSPPCTEPRCRRAADQQAASMSRSPSPPEASGSSSAETLVGL